MHQPDYSISTPENVDLHLEIAGLGNRLLAQIIDGAIMFGIGLVFVVIAVVAAVVVATADALDSKTKGILYAVIVLVIIFILFILQYGYFLICEGVMHGQTPGKKQAGIRVIEQNGQPIGWPAAIIRNLVRIIDSVMVLGILVILLDKNERRLGDMAAGTIVIRERKTEISTSHIKMETKATADTSLDVGRVTPVEYDLLVDYLRRRDALAKNYRPEVAQKLAIHFKHKLNDQVIQFAADVPEGESAVAVAPEGEKADEYLERIYLTYQQRAQD